MSKYNELEILIKIYESKMEPKVTGAGGVYQVIGNCHASIALSSDDAEEKPLSKPGMVLFPNFSGRISRFYKTVEDFDAGVNARLIIDYSNSYKNAQGAYVEQTQPSLELQAVLEVETMQTFKSGFAVSERDENNAAAAGMEMSDYTKLMNECLDTANNMGGDLQTPEEKATSEKSATEQMENEIG